MSQPILLIAIPLGLAFLSIILKKIKVPLLVLGLLFSSMLVFFIEKKSYIIGGFKPPFGINLVVDDYNLYFIIIVNVLFLVLVLANLSAVKPMATVLLVASAGLNGLLLTGDLFNLFVFIEIASIAAFILLTMDKQFLKVFHYIIIGTLASSLYLLGIVILYAQYGTLNMADMSGLIDGGSITPTIAYLLIFAGLAVEVKLLPFNGWVKGVLETASAFTGPLIGSLYAGVMLVVFGRVFGGVLNLSGTMVTSLTIIGVITLLAGEFMAFQSKHLRQVWLNSSIAQSGLAVILFLQGLHHVAVLVIVANIISKFVLYLVSGKIAASIGHDKIADLKGIFMNKKALGIAFTITSLSLIGLPLFFGFFVKINILIALFQSSNMWIPALVLIAALIESAYVIRLLVTMWQVGEEGEKPETIEKPTFSLKVGFVTCAISIILGLMFLVSVVYPDLVINQSVKAGNVLNVNDEVQVFTMEGGLE
jgi:formate hydrogenlyase subunit 3/multisubunit Na+/H+ antiporter MnhD subunit